MSKCNRPARYLLVAGFLATASASTIARADNGTAVDPSTKGDKGVKKGDGKTTKPPEERNGPNPDTAPPVKKER